VAVRDQEEQDWKIEQMQAGIANKKADTALKAERLRWEPWKALSAAFAAGIAVATGLIGAIARVLSHYFASH
jgi:hypothetical protein